MKKIKKFKDDLSKHDSKRKHKSIKPKKTSRFSQEENWNKNNYRNYINEEE